METNHITLDSVESSQIGAIGHDPLTSTLAVQFKAKKDAPASIYHYANVDAAEFEVLKTAQSPGSHFAKNIKAFPQKYPCKRIPAPEVEV
ncbi:KTSC domain-containing protein [Paraburkholderia elongata]|uniref:KTSC domain-containing protein n=1 Tax=Paraburkholderia elongata TaxID=2675747 RepID=A0A972NV80_9BURK|nr:KTSC domain-containing protein [Paraburkholderia elongata]NPT59716.1 KTSC domain-containing protein [Paraburkholderia elongata]